MFLRSPWLTWAAGAFVSTFALAHLGRRRFLPGACFSRLALRAVFLPGARPNSLALRAVAFYPALVLTRWRSRLDFYLGARRINYQRDCLSCLNLGIFETPGIEFDDPNTHLLASGYVSQKRILNMIVLC